MTREQSESHQLMARIEADLEQVHQQREALETDGHDHFHGALQSHLPNLTEETLDGWLQQANALHGTQECRRERTE